MLIRPVLGCADDRTPRPVDSLAAVRHTEAARWAFTVFLLTAGFQGAYRLCLRMLWRADARLWIFPITFRLVSTPFGLCAGLRRRVTAEPIAVAIRIAARRTELPVVQTDTEALRAVAAEYNVI
jgi:hypothetical protein